MLRLRHRWMNSIKLDITEIKWVQMGLILLMKGTSGGIMLFSNELPL